MSSLGVHVLCQESIYCFGTEEQKQKYLIPSSSGKYLAAFALTEPAAGSDTAAIETSAEFTGNGYLLNGTKTFITSGAAADYFIVMARLSDGSGITSFIVEKDFAGLTIGQKFDLLGMRGYATCELVFDRCRVNKENLLGEHGSGRKVALTSLTKGRVTIAAQAVGWAQGALDAAVYVFREREEKLDGSAAYLLGDLLTTIESARVLTYYAAAGIDSGQVDASLSGMAKIRPPTRR